MGSAKKRWLASERLAFRILESQGYNILEHHKKIKIDDVEVTEVDAIAIGRNGQKYAVEVKAGKIDVQGVRQAYTNALLLGAKPLVIARGFADDSARKLAENLDVKVIELDDVFLVDATELEHLVYTATLEAFSEALLLLLDTSIKINPAEIDIVKALAESNSLKEAAKKANADLEKVARIVEFLRSNIPLARRGGFKGLRLSARILYYKTKLQALLESLDTSSSRIEELLEKLERIL